MTSYVEGLDDDRMGLWQTVAGWSVRTRGYAALILLDLVLVVVAYLGMLVARFDMAVPADAWNGLRGFLPLAMGVHLTANWLAGLYGPVWEQASIREAQRLLAAGVLALVALTSALVFLPRLVPLSVAIVGSAIAMGLFGILRFHSRLFAFRRRPHGETRVLIVGAGQSAASLLRELDRGEETELQPVALLDDDPRKLGRRLGGVPIVGTVDDLATTGRALEIDQVLLAIPSATSHLVHRVADSATQFGAQLKVLPRVSELVNGSPHLRDVRDLSIDDLLGRQQIATDLTMLAAMVQGRRVLVTGGGGSIGSEIARQLSLYGPDRLVLVDRDETHLFDAAEKVEGPCEQVLLDVRDRQGVEELFAAERPQIVFHAAANKHVPLLETHPCEAVATNVFGTWNLACAARDNDVDGFVLISTDKAVNPTSVMGASKRVCEQVVLSLAPSGSAWCAVRFGNVLGSRGSVVPTFVRQIRKGGPVTLTHPDMTRYFMSIPEAVQLVLQAGALARQREIFVLDMGEPVRILDLAHRMISLAGLRPDVDILIEITGPRPGERLNEVLNTAEEHPADTSHPKIMQLNPPLLANGALTEALGRLSRSVEARDDHEVRRLLFDLASHDTPIIRLPTPASESAHLSQREHA